MKLLLQIDLIVHSDVSDESLLIYKLQVGAEKWRVWRFHHTAKRPTAHFLSC